jgi:TRAP-type C4-dicarboxylate transport system substrate-binding protein
MANPKISTEDIKSLLHSDIERAMKMHELALDDAQMWKAEIKDCVQEAKGEGITVKELMQWTGYSRHWIHELTKE